MTLSLPLGLRLPSEPLNHPPGAPREPDTDGCTIYPASGEERIRPEQAKKLGQDSLDTSQNFQAGLRGSEPATAPHRSPEPSSHEDPVGGKHPEHPISLWEVLEAERDSLHFCLLGLGLRLQDLERSLGPWTSAQSRMVWLQALQADLCGAAERVDALLAFDEGLAQWSEPQIQASLEQILRTLGAHRNSIFQHLWWLQAQLVRYSLVLEEANMLDQDLENEGDLDEPGRGGIWGPWAPAGLPIPAELEWDPAGDVGGLRPLGRKSLWTPGAPCELCGHRGSQGRGQSLEDVIVSGLSHWKHLSSHQRCSLLRKPQDKKRKAFPKPQDVTLEVDLGTSIPASWRFPTFLLFLLFLLLVGITLLLPMSGGPCYSHARLARTPYVVLSYVNGAPPT